MVSVHDRGWNIMEKFGIKQLFAVNPKYTSQDCSNCGHRVNKTLSTRTHVCPSCHAEICRDTNAARNILSRGARNNRY